jgi:hypothetical protein
MIADSVSFRGHRCFKTQWAGFCATKLINVIIGRNNTGKTHLLDLAAAVCEHELSNTNWEYRCKGVLDEGTLASIFERNTSGGALAGSHWDDHGAKFVDVSVTWHLEKDGSITDLSFEDGFSPASPYGFESTQARIDYVKRGLKKSRHKLFGSFFRRLLADRDIRSEPAESALQLSQDGTGATNIIRRYIVTANPQFPRNLIQRDLLAALNKIFGQDGNFSEIQVKLHDDASTGRPQHHWEVYLGEEKKGLIPLSSSGSGLKTVILVLLNLLVLPEIEKKPKSRFVFAFEELENNLHPALLRRLFQFLEDYAVKENVTIFLTTHSSTALDIFGVSKNAQIIHVTHDGEEARAVTVSAHFDHLGVISELGAKPSDLLQANGVIWVEGPSDCIYLNRWLDLYTEGRLQEGRDYVCAFYGGSLLARTQFKSPEEAEAELVNLFRVNSNIVVICDGDRSAPGARVKDRVRRISAEVRNIPGAHVWVTQAREIENYIPGAVLEKAAELAKLPDPDQYGIFFPRKGAPGTSYIESRMNRKSLDKMDLSILSVPHMDKAMMSTRFDWESQMCDIVNRIDAWNR